MAEQQNATFVQGMFADKKTFNNGGEIIKVSFKIEDLIPFLQENVNSKGYVNVEIKTAKADPNKLYATLNDWKPAGEDDGLPY